MHSFNNLSLQACCVTRCSAVHGAGFLPQLLQLLHLAVAGAVRLLLAWLLLLLLLLLLPAAGAHPVCRCWESPTCPCTSEPASGATAVTLLNHQITSLPIQAHIRHPRSLHALNEPAHCMCSVSCPARLHQHNKKNITRRNGELGTNPQPRLDSSGSPARWRPLGPCS